MDPAAFVDPLGLAIVAGGSLLSAALRSTGGDVAAALRALAPLVCARPAADSEAARVAVGRIQRLAEVRDLSCADRVETAQPFLRQAARRLSDMPDAAAFRGWAEAVLTARAARHKAVHDLWCAAADAAPAMGLVGTIIGLVAMFAGMDDVAAIGPAMALALLTTLYGAVLANLIFGPVAARLARLSELELAWQRDAIERLARLAAVEAAPRHLRVAA